MLIPATPEETPQQKAERQARLSHAMGLMFLQDKVDKLERDVSKITYPRGIRQTKSGPAADFNTTNNRNSTAQAQGRPKPRAETGPGFATRPDASASTDTAAQDTTSTRTIRLVDASVLIFSLRSVHNWSRDRSTCVIIPLEAINTLDLLKKGDQPINLAARKATRWLEDKIAVSTQHGDAMLTHPAPGIFAQKESFRATSAQIQKARSATRTTSTESGSTDRNTDSATHAAKKDLFNASEAPRYLCELISVCLYCHQAALPASNFAVAIAYPPAHLQDKMIEPQTTAHEKPSYLVRTDGRATEAWLDAYGIPFEVAPTSKTWTGEKPSSRFRGEITSIHGTGSSDDISSSKHERTRGASPTPSVSSSIGSFKSELSGLSMLSSHKSPRHCQDQRFNNSATTLRSMQNAPDSSSAATIASSDDTEDDTAKGPIIARPSSAASSHTSFVSSFLTTSTVDDWSSQTSASHSSHCGTRITRHLSSSGIMDAFSKPSSENVSTSASSWSVTAPRLTSRTLHKTRSGADKMEEYLRRLEVGAGANTNTNANGGEGGVERRMASSTPTPTNTVFGGAE